MIPKIIHYCWFGGNPLPDDAKKCISSWRKFFPDYEIIEWNESNFDVNIIPYTRQAYEERKFAFVSDYARYWILYHFGGIYFDTDVEVIKWMDDILSSGPYLGFEIDPNNEFPYGAVNPGVGMGAVPGMLFYKKILDYYKTLEFRLSDGSLNIKDAVVNITTRELSKLGLTGKPGIQRVADISIYPSQFFNPFDDSTGKLRITDSTHTIHWFSKSWLTVSSTRIKVSRFLHRVLGVGLIKLLKSSVGKS